jgi:hypothetical protein
MIVDAWAQHPTPRSLRHPMFESFRRWTGAAEVPNEIPVGFTTGAMEAGGVERALTCAWQESLFECLMGVVLVPLGVPWGYFLRHYITAPGDPWSGTRSGPRQTTS